MLSDVDLERAMAAWHRQGQDGNQWFISIGVAAALSRMPEAEFVARLDEFLTRVQEAEPHTHQGGPQ